MSHISFTYHIVWRTRCSRQTIAEDHERDLYAYIFGICREKKAILYRINSMPDHIHMCVGIPPTISVADFVQVVKQESSRWIRDHRDWFPLFDYWGNGYAAFSYSVKERDNVIEYIRNQKVHHQTKTFREEYDEWLTEMGMNPAEDLLLKD